jgi:hypothetical protein
MIKSLQVKNKGTANHDAIGQRKNRPIKSWQRKKRKCYNPYNYLNRRENKIEKAPYNQPNPKINQKRKIQNGRKRTKKNIQLIKTLRAGSKFKNSSHGIL